MLLVRVGRYYEASPVMMKTLRHDDMETSPCRSSARSTVMRPSAEYAEVARRSPSAREYAPTSCRTTSSPDAPSKWGARGVGTRRVRPGRRPVDESLPSARRRLARHRMHCRVGLARVLLRKRAPTATSTAAGRWAESRPRRFHPAPRMSPASTPLLSASVDTTRGVGENRTIRPWRRGPLIRTVRNEPPALVGNGYPR